MDEKAEFSGSVSIPERRGSTEPDVWAQLDELASLPDADPVLRLLVGEAITSHRNLRGVTATIANRYRAMIDAVPDAITIHNESGRILDANASACRLFDRDREILLESSIEDVFPDLDRNFIAHLCAAFDTEAPVIATSSIHREDGRESCLELNAQGYLDANQKRVIAVTRDLGPRSLAEIQLRNSEAELRRILYEMDKGVVVRNRMGHIVSSNPAACRILQMSEPDLIALRSDQIGDWLFVDQSGTSVAHECLPWAQAMRYGKAIESAICGIKSPTMTELCWLAVTAVPQIGNGDGCFDEVVSVFADITPIKQDAALFAHTQSLTNLGAWQLAADGEHMMWSSQMHAIFDVPLGTPLSRQRMLSHFAGMDQRRLRQALDAAKIGETTELTARMSTAIGRRRQVRIHVRALGRDSKLGCAIGCVQDITAETDRESADPSE